MVGGSAGCGMPPKMKAVGCSAQGELGSLSLSLADSTRSLGSESTRGVCDGCWATHDLKQLLRKGHACTEVRSPGSLAGSDIGASFQRKILVCSGGVAWGF